LVYGGFEPPDLNGGSTKTPSGLERGDGDPKGERVREQSLPFRHISENTPDKVFFLGSIWSVCTADSIAFNEKRLIELKIKTAA